MPDEMRKDTIEELGQHEGVIENTIEDAPAEVSETFVHPAAAVPEEASQEPEAPTGNQPEVLTADDAGKAAEPEPANDVANAVSSPQKKKGKGLKKVAIGVVAILILAAVGAAYYVFSYIPSSNLKMAQDYVDKKDYASAVAIYASMPGNAEAQAGARNVFKRVAGQDYLDEATVGISYQKNYVTEQAKSIAMYAIRAYYGNASTDDLFDFDDPNYKGVRDCATKLNTMKADADKAFSKENLDKLGDGALLDAYEKFEELHSITKEMLSTTKSSKYIAEIVSGSTSSMDTDVTKATLAATAYQKAFDALG